MEKTLIKNIAALTLAVLIPLVILSLLLFKGQAQVALAIAVGALLGILRLEIFFGYIIRTINQRKSTQANLALMKYLASWLFTLGAIGFVVHKSVKLGLAAVFGLLTVSIAVTLYSFAKGITQSRNQ